jgi:D-lactate dehydrogenase
LAGVSVDYALPKAQGAVPPPLALDGPGGGVALRMRYSHLGCNVVHEDVAFAEVSDLGACFAGAFHAW